VGLVSTEAITAIVVSRDLSALLDHCLGHLFDAIDAAPSGAHSVVVVDNASTPPYAPGALPGRCRALRFDRHQSFAAANNRAAQAAPGDLYLLVNNDIFLHRDAVVGMLDVLNREPQAGICGARLVFPSGAIQHAGVAFRAGRNAPYHWQRGVSRELVPAATREWQAVTGACMLVRAAVWDALGGLDERYPFGLEDIDFCLRARQCGWRVFCAGNVESLHLEARTPGRSALDRASRRVFRKTWRGRYAIDG
jgi:GT2 family glycosyltransferase